MIMESKFGRTHPVNTAEAWNFALVLSCDDIVGTCCRGGMCGLVCVVCVGVDVQTTEKLAPAAAFQCRTIRHA